MKKKIIILILVVLILLGAFYQYKMISKHDVTVEDQKLSIEDVIHTDLGTRKDGETIYQSHLFKSYEEYKEFMKDYDKELLLKEKDFVNNDFVLDFQSYAECTDEDYKKITNLKIENSILYVSYDVYNKCGDCDSKNIAYLIPIEKGLMKELLPVEAIYNNKNPETTC